MSLDSYESGTKNVGHDKWTSNKYLQIGKNQPEWQHLLTFFLKIFSLVFSESCGNNGNNGKLHIIFEKGNFSAYV